MGHSLAIMAKSLQPIIILVLVLIAVKIFGGYGFWWRKTKKRYHPIAGTIVHMFLNFRRLQDYLTDISRKYKTFRLYSPFCNMICTTDPAIVEYILKTNFKNYGKGQYNYENLKELFGDGIFAVDGVKWRHQRKLASYEFSARSLRNFSTTIFKTNATKLATVIFDKAKSDAAFDIQEKKEDIISRFMTEMEHEPESITYEYLKDIALNFVIAGKDTTAGTLSWFIYLLCKHPSVQEKIFQEVKEVTGQEGQDIRISEFAEKITEESLDKMKYLHAALSETLRLYPTVPLNMKSCFSDDTLPDGFNVNQGDMVFYMPYPMGRMEILWGNDAENFQPERWLKDDGSVQNESPFKFTAFQAGPRICLGKDFAYTQMKIFAAVLLYFFKFKLSCKSKDVHYKTMINLHIDKGLYVHAYLR